MAKANSPVDLSTTEVQNPVSSAVTRVNGECPLGYECPCWSFQNGRGCPEWERRVTSIKRGVSAMVV